MVDLCRRYQATLFSRTRAGLTAVKAAKSELYELPAALLTEFPGDIGTPGQAIEFKFEDRLNPRDFTIDMWLKVDPGNDQTEYTIADCYKQESKQGNGHRGEPHYHKLQRVQCETAGYEPEDRYFIRKPNRARHG